MFVATIVFKHFNVTCLFSDIDECADNPSVCNYRCKNTHGGFECICAPGQVRLADRKSCAG